MYGCQSFLFVSADAARIGDVARQVRDEGHDARYYIESQSDRETADGFVPKTDDWRADADWADTIVFDDIWVDSAVGTGELAQELGAHGHAVVGGTPNTDRLEEDHGGDVADVLAAYEQAWGRRMKGFQLQRKVEGVEVAVCGFFNVTEFVEPVNFNFAVGKRYELSDPTHHPLLVHYSN
jgi:phosphoribosylamine--glycine ligase